MKRVITLLLSLLCAISLPSFAHAVTIETYAYRGSTGPLTEEVFASASLGAISSSVTGNDMYSIGHATAQANDSGALAVSSSWEGTGYDFDGYESSAFFSETYSNDSEEVQYYNFDFNIPIYYQGIYGESKISVFPTSTIEIQLNGITIWESSTSMWADNHMPPEYYYTSDIDLEYIDNGIYDSIGDPLSYDAYLSGTYSNTFYLGSLSPGESLALQYNIATNSWGMDSGQTNSFITANGSVYSSSSPVPEPATVVLIGTGLIGLIGMGRKRTIK